MPQQTSMYSQPRDRLVRFLRTQLIGPISDGKPLRQPPLDRFALGMLSPIVRMGSEGLDPASFELEEDESDTASQDSDKKQPEIIRSRYTPPSSLGFSFFVKGDPVQFEVSFSAASYLKRQKDNEGDVYESVPLDVDGLTFSSSSIEPSGGKEERSFILDSVATGNSKDASDRHPLAGLTVIWRPKGEGWLVTISAYNVQEHEFNGGHDYTAIKVSLTLFHAHLSCTIHRGRVGDYPRQSLSLLTEEEQELELQYRSRKIYAVGHGCAVDWTVQNDTVTELQTAFMPAVEVPQVTADTAARASSVGDALSMHFLAQCGETSESTAAVMDALDAFVTGYDNWLHQQFEDAAILDADFVEVASRILQRSREASSRMAAAVQHLRRNPATARCFGLANRAMLMQMQQVDKVKRKLSSAENYRWRPFQLAFVLTTLVSTIDEDDAHRDTVDLIWFPTGGGKTEAYLLLMAFYMLWRRSTHTASGHGLAIILRYTLRLLTTQQFSRATRLVFALEKLRRQKPEYGRNPLVSVSG